MIGTWEKREREEERRGEERGRREERRGKKRGGREEGRGKRGGEGRKKGEESMMMVASHQLQTEGTWLKGSQD